MAGRAAGEQRLQRRGRVRPRVADERVVVRGTGLAEEDDRVVGRAMAERARRDEVDAAEPRDARASLPVVAGERGRDEQHGCRAAGARATTSTRAFMAHLRAAWTRRSNHRTVRNPCALRKTDTASVSARVQPLSITSGAPVNARAVRAEQKRNRVRDLGRLEQPFQRLRRQDHLLEHALLGDRRARAPGRRSAARRAACARSPGRRPSRGCRRVAPSSASVLTSPSTPCFAADVAGLERRRDEAVHRRDDDDPPVAGCAERRPGVPREEERAREQEREQRVPAVFVELLDRRDVLEAGVRHDRVEPAEALERRVDRRAVAVAVVRSAANGVARPVGIRLEVDREHAASRRRRDARAIARPIPPAAPVTSAPLTRSRAAADVDHLAGDVRRVVRAEERDHAGDVLRLADAPKRRLLGDGRLEVLEGDADPLGGLRGHRRRDEARARRS